MNRLQKFLLLGLAALLMLGVSLSQRGLNEQRTKMGFRRGADLKDAPPALQFTTVALGGFRGIIANILWMRTTELQDQDKFFETVQLADWITKLEPRLKQVWIVQAWNMAYNISVKFTEPEDRWRWVQRGIELLRDDALRYNPDETLIYRELAWFFQHKMGQNLDDANQYYKRAWYDQMTAVLGTNSTGYLELIDPKTDDAKARAIVLRDKYKMDPKRMRDVDQRYGPLEWRLPESHAIYWAALGLVKSKPEDEVTLRRVIYQSMQLSFQRGRIIVGRAGAAPIYAPNLEIIDKVNAAYETMIREEKVENMKSSMFRAHRNFLRQAVFHLYSHSRLADAGRWFKYLKEKYPNDQEVNAAGGDLDTYALGKISEGVGEMDANKIKTIIDGFLRNSYMCLALDDDERAEGFVLMARKTRERYQAKIAGEERRVGLPEFSEMRRQIQAEMLDPQRGLEAPYRAILRTKLGLPPEMIAAPEKST